MSRPRGTKNRESHDSVQYLSAFLEAYKFALAAHRGCVFCVDNKADTNGKYKGSEWVFCDMSGSVGNCVSTWPREKGMTMEKLQGRLNNNLLLCRSCFTKFRWNGVLAPIKGKGEDTGPGTGILLPIMG